MFTSLNFPLLSPVSEKGGDMDQTPAAFCVVMEAPHSS